MGQQDGRADAIEETGEPVRRHVFGQGEVCWQRAIACDELVHRVVIIRGGRPLRM